MTSLNDDLLRFTGREVEEIRRAISESDALWDLRASLGEREGRGGLEYSRESPCPHLRRMLGECTREEIEVLELIEEQDEEED